MKQVAGFLALLLLLSASNPLWAQGSGSVTGRIRDPKAGRPLADANVILMNPDLSAAVSRTVTGSDGSFSIAGVPLGTYVVECSFIGYRSYRTPAFSLTLERPKVDLGDIRMTESAFALDEVVVSAEKELYHYTIDRKVYNVGTDLTAGSGTASDLLQNVPSVQVDMDGNVSLRGSPDVMILVNGKQSPLMGNSRADVLQQLPASNIEKIEVITNPSARFTPQGTAGIINIVLKQEHASGWNGDLTGRLGVQSRSGESLSFNDNAGRVNVFGTYAHRYDRRRRSGTDSRVLTDATSGAQSFYQENNQTTRHPLVDMGTFGLNFRPPGRDSFELSGEVFSRRPGLDGLSTIVTRDGQGIVLQDYDRLQTGSESETETGLTAAAQHNFRTPEDNLRVEASLSHSPESENTQFTDVLRTPPGANGYDGIVLDQTENQRHVAVDYANQLATDWKLQAGYAWESTKQDIRSNARVFDPAQQQFVPDPNKTYRFRLDQGVHSVYGTLEHAFGPLGVLGGLRFETASITSDLVSNGVTVPQHDSGLYPTLHLAYEIDEHREVQLNYSRRINRPESDDLNPFPEYTDPYSMEAGNPRLKPEAVHSIECGYAWRNDGFSLIPTLYYRYKQNGFTRLTTQANDSTLLRTMANLGRDQSAGLEPVATVKLGKAVNANLNGNLFYEQIDASNIGYGSRKSVVSWSGTCNLDVRPLGGTLVQVNTWFRSARLTPQGEMRPSTVVNLGVKQDLKPGTLFATLVVSDVFATSRQDVNLTMTGIDQQVRNRRDSRVAYLSLTYHYGQAEKQGKEKSLQYEDQQP